ncbi:MAG: serine/threonine-protein kinase [Planctomycetota bacterium]|jgi:tRNA A-37 threonylcarbamoyl transferase component Bud32
MRVDDEAKTRLSESVPDPLVGREFDGYRIEEILGRGGMGVVYKATQSSLGRPVAIKVLPEEVLENRQFLDRFEREVDILARLSHPNIVTVFERGEIDGRPYIAMEYVRGTSLRDVMRKGPLPPAEALSVVRSVLAALEHAHGQGIVHRDIKPENVLVAPGGIVKVADFGLSRHLEGEDRTRLTKTYVALGTFEYMSPEQREMSRDADGRSDLYATGVVLYEMIAGELPIGAFEPLSHKRPGVCDSRIDDVVERSLKKSPDSRWQDARSMGDAVSRLLSNVPVEPVPVPVPAPAPPAEEHGPKWKRMLSNIFGQEYPVARIEGKLPRKFAEKVLEDVAVQRYLGKLVTLWPHFPGGLEFSKEGSRLVLELGGLRGDDPVRDKRVAAAVGAVLAANAHGKLRRIAVGDHEWEDANADALVNPPIVAQFEPIRPSAIPVQSQVVSGVESKSTGIGWPLIALVLGLVGLVAMFWVIRSTVVPHGDGTGHSSPLIWGLLFALCGLVAGVSFLWFVVRGARPRDGTKPEYSYGFPVTLTALWVAIVVATAGELRDEETAWLCVGAMVSVFVLARLPALLRNAGQALVFLFVTLLVLALGAGGLYLSVGVDEMRMEQDMAAEIRPDPVETRTLRFPKAQERAMRVARETHPVPKHYVRSIVENAELRTWAGELIPFAEPIIRNPKIESGDEGVTLVIPASFIEERRRHHWQELGIGTSVVEIDRIVDREVEAIAAVYGLAAHAMAPLAVERVAMAAPEWEKIFESKPFGSIELRDVKYQLGIAPNDLSVRFGARITGSVASKQWLLEAVPGLVAGDLAGIRIRADHKNVLSIEFPRAWQFDQIKKLSRGQLDRRMADLSFCFAHIAEMTDPRITRTAMGSDEMEAYFAKNPFKKARAEPIREEDPLSPFLDFDVELARSESDLPETLPDVLYDTPAVRTKAIALVDGADVLYREGIEVAVEGGKSLTIQVPRGTQLALHRYFQAKGMTPQQAQAAVGPAVHQFAATLAVAAHTFVPMRLERRVHADKGFEKLLRHDSKLGDPLLLPETTSLRIEMASVDGELPKDWAGRFRDDRAAWEWIRKVLGAQVGMPTPEQVGIVRKDDKLVFSFDDEWRKRMLVRAWHNYAGDEKFAREYIDTLLEGIAAAAAITLEARYPGKVKRTRVADKSYEARFRMRSFDGK